MKAADAIKDPRWKDAHESKGFRIYHAARPLMSLPWVVTDDGNYRGCYYTFRAAKRAVRRLRRQEVQPEWWERPPVWTEPS